MGAGWVINLAVAEWVIRKRPVLQPARHQPLFPTQPEGSGLSSAAELRSAAGMHEERDE